MKNPKTYNTYVSVTLYHGKYMNSARIFTCVESCNLRQHLEVEYQSGKQELANLMLRFMQMPDVHRYEDGTKVYTLHGFLD